ncbi:MAG: response regulator transcription factor, partial [Chloroflexi bacterium]|nr:response regulator transcription factor [Chloroflexota bacterium]
MDVLLAHPSPTVAEGLLLVLERYGQFRSVQVVHSVAALLDHLRNHPPGIIAVHSDLPELDYGTLISRVRQASPECGVVIVSGSNAPEDMRRAIQAGARAYLSVDVQPAEFVRQVQFAAGGDVIISGQVATEIPDVLPAAPGSQTDDQIRAEHELSSRELEVLRLIAEGRTNPEIARALTVTENTVKAHVRSIL